MQVQESTFCLHLDSHHLFDPFNYPIWLIIRYSESIEFSDVSSPSSSIVEHSHRGYGVGSVHKQKQESAPVASLRKLSNSFEASLDSDDIVFSSTAEDEDEDEDQDGSSGGGSLGASSSSVASSRSKSRSRSFSPSTSSMSRPLVLGMADLLEVADAVGASE